MIVAAVALLLLGLAASLPAAGATTAYVSSTPGTYRGQGTVSLMKALADQNVDRIELVGDYAAGDEFDPLQGAPFPINRNITLTSTPGSWYTLDLNFAHSVVEICSSCRFSLLANLTMANARRGTSPLVDFFVGQPGSVLVLNGIYRHRLACTEAHDSAQTLRGLPRSAILPGAKQPQQLHIKNITYQGKEYPDSILYEDITWDAPRQVDEGRGYTGGYAQHAINSFRVCEHYVTKECLEGESAEACVNKLIDQVEEQQRSQGKLSGPLMAVAIAVPLVAALLLGGVLGMVLYHRKQKKLYAAAKTLLDSEAGTGTPGERMTGKSYHGSGGASLMPKGTDKGWELASSFVSPFLGTVEDPDAPIEFREFIGAGSFGRVYRGRWDGRDVAVKVVEHNQDTAESVVNEMHLLMAFNSPYVIRAYRCLTYRRLLAPERSESLLAGTRDSMDNNSMELNSFGGTPLNDQSSVAAAAAAAAAGAGSSGGGKRKSNSSFERSRSIGSSNAAVKPSRKSGDAAAAASETSRSSAGVGQGSRGSKNVHEGMNMLATWLVQEYCDQGTLKAFLARNEVPARLAACDEQAVLLLVLMLRDTAKGLAALHNQAVVHGDLNSRNVLVATDTASEAGATAKIADLGISKAIAQHKTHRTTTNLGTITHSAPELLRSGRMSPHVDVYSFGIMMWELFTGQEAFGKLLYGQFFETIVANDLRPVVPPSMPQDYTTLMEHAWATDPSERPTAQQLVECLSHIAGSRIAALQAGAVAVSNPAAAAAAAAAAQTAAPVTHKSAEELLSNPAKRQVQREQQQQQNLLKAASLKSAVALPARRLSLTIGDGERPDDVSDDSGSNRASPVAARRPLSGSGVRSFFSKLAGNGGSSSNIFGGSSRPGSRDHSKELPTLTPKSGGLSPLAGAGQSQWFV
ncbi:hypothetical protein OEZ86_014694 [Tetradesmus obliquus]|nr:hypothetical protein OEZ86_014694 [Tetradesmus obliquus]